MEKLETMIVDIITGYINESKSKVTLKEIKAKTGLTQKHIELVYQNKELKDKIKTLIFEHNNYTVIAILWKKYNN